jgi:serine/threonine-protein kinase HipA
MDKCLFCYLPLTDHEKDFHATCSRKMFGVSNPPQVPYTLQQLEGLALQLISSNIAVTGVQPKLSVHFRKTTDAKEQQRLTIVGVLGDYILKTPVNTYPYLPEVEDLTMHLATKAKINVVPHSLIRLSSGTLAYITRRIDRKEKAKLHMEDMCQLTERLTEDKYHGSYEQIGKTILQYSRQPGLDLVNFYEQVLFSFLTGNADMHLKNFSLIYKEDIGPVLAPGYDMVSTALVYPADDEDLALTLNGKKRRLKKSDFIQAFNLAKLDRKQQENLFRKFYRVKTEWMRFIELSFLPDDLKSTYKDIIRDRYQRLEAN